jgi:hypothetical protein
MEIAENTASKLIGIIPNINWAFSKIQVRTWYLAL